MSTLVAKKCLEEAGMSPSELELLIFSGVYRDDHIGEPSVASLIQREIGANPTLYPLDSRTFSFDINSGGCGLINAFQIMDGFISSKKISRGMIITGDSEPVRGQSEFYNFRSSASAIILEKSEGNEGFELIKTYSYPEYQDSFESYISWKRKKGKLRKKNVLVVNQSDSFLQECLECTYQSLNSFLKQMDLNISEIDLIIPSQSPKGIVEALDNRLGSQGNLVRVKDLAEGELHTSGPSFALRDAWDKGFFANAKKIIFLTTGAGISNSIALYINE